MFSLKWINAKGNKIDFAMEESRVVLGETLRQSSKVMFLLNKKDKKLAKILRLFYEIDSSTLQTIINKCWFGK